MSTQRIKKNKMEKNDGAAIADQVTASFHPTPGMAGMYSVEQSKPKKIQEGRTMKIDKNRGVDINE